MLSSDVDTGGFRFQGLKRIVGEATRSTVECTYEVLSPQVLRHPAGS
jgi:hypothetical protein